MGSALGRKLSAGNFRRRLLQSISAARRDDERAKVAGSDEPTSEQDRCVCVCEQMAGGGWIGHNCIPAPGNEPVYVCGNQRTEEPNPDFHRIFSSNVCLFTLGYKSSLKVNFGED